MEFPLQSNFRTRYLQILKKIPLRFHIYELKSCTMGDGVIFYQLKLKFEGM